MATEKNNATEKLNATEQTDATLSKEPLNKHPETVPTMLEKGTEVSVNKTTLTGKVAGYHLSADNTTLSYLVDYEDEGEKLQRAFTPNQITKK